MGTLLLILGLILFLGLVVIHEFGHFLMARRNGVVVEEFGIGFPPRLVKRRLRGGWLFTVNLLPLGGFVKLKGEHDSDTASGTFGASSLSAKAKILTAGVVMNFIVAYLLLVLLALVGMPQIIDGQFVVKRDAVYIQYQQIYVTAGKIEANSPAAKAGIKSGDVIIKIGQLPRPLIIKSVDVLPKLTQQYAGQSIVIEYKDVKTNKVIDKIVDLRSREDVEAARKKGKSLGYLGVSVYQSQSGLDVIKSTWSAPIVAAGLIKQFTIITFVGLGKALSGVASIIAGALTGNIHARVAGQNEASSQVAGPVGIFFVFKYGSALGLRFILLVVALLSLTLSIMNILPLPALDGGRLWLMLFTRLIKRPLSPLREEAINATGFIFLIGLAILITIVDVRRFL